MADTESILQLGIEAARAGDKEEARNLFRLLTRETPEDPQAWLWLAGVAEDREEKRAALEQVTNLDPSNELAKQGLAALGGPSKAPKAAPPPAPAAASADDFSFDWNQPAATETPSFAVSEPEPAPPPATPARTRELTPDEEFAMSLDSFGSLSNTYNERSKSGGDALDFNIPDFGDDDDLDLSAYMNRERVDMSTIEVTAEEAKKPVRKQISKGGISDDAKARYKEKKPRVAGARASGGFLPLILALLCGLAAVALIWMLFFRDKGPGPVAGDVTATAGSVAGGLATSLPGTTGPEVPLPTLDPAAPTVDPNAGGGVTDGQPTAVPGGETPTEAAPPPDNTGAGGSPDANLAALGGVQPQILPADGFSPVTVDNWFFNFGGVTTIADGNVIGVQPQGRWLLVGVLMFDGSLEGRTIPGDLMVLKDAQGRVYRANPDASEAYLNAYPGSFNINLKQPAPINFNFSVPLLFDVSPDATDLVLFSPQATDVGYAVRANTQ